MSCASWQARIPSMAARASLNWPGRCWRCCPPAFTAPQIRAEPAPRRAAPRRSSRPSVVRQAITLLVNYPERGRDVPQPAGLAQVQLKGVGLLLELLDLTRHNPGLTAAAIVERFRERAEGPHLAELLASNLLVQDAAAARELADSLQRIVVLGREERMAELMVKAQSPGLTAAEKEEFRQLQRDVMAGIR